MQRKTLKVKNGYRPGQRLTILGEVWQIVSVRDVAGDFGKYWIELEKCEVSK